MSLVLFVNGTYGLMQRLPLNNGFDPPCMNFRSNGYGGCFHVLRTIFQPQTALYGP